MFDTFDLSRALEGDGMVNFGFGVCVTSKYESAVHYLTNWMNIVPVDSLDFYRKSIEYSSDFYENLVDYSSDFFICLGIISIIYASSPSPLPLTANNK